MSLVKRELQGKTYYYFKYERHGEIYLGSEGGVNSDRVGKAISYLDKRIAHYQEVRERVFSLLPKEERRRLWTAIMINAIQYLRLHLGNELSTHTIAQEINAEPSVVRNLLLSLKKRNRLFKKDLYYDENKDVFMLPDRPFYRSLTDEEIHREQGALRSEEAQDRP